MYAYLALQDSSLVFLAASSNGLTKAFIFVAHLVTLNKKLCCDCAPPLPQKNHFYMYAYLALQDSSLVFPCNNIEWPYKSRRESKTWKSSVRPNGIAQPRKNPPLPHLYSVQRKVISAKDTILLSKKVSFMHRELILLVTEATLIVLWQAPNEETNIWS